MTEQQAHERLVKYVKSVGTQRAAAKALGISQPYLGDMLRGNRAVSIKVLAMFGLERKHTIVAVSAS